jgi:hypothetical protein
MIGKYVALVAYPYSMFSMTAARTHTTGGSPGTTIRSMLRDDATITDRVMTVKNNTNKESFINSTQEQE